ncbi:MAG: hypothetical protein LLG97_16565, partial [Deltaproteobacteria bacterium]|nr:hypothetical protein [Deltaproteobacteria bacterium]
HLKTFKYKVFKHIPQQYFMHDGKYGKAASDLALMFSIIEIAGMENTHFIKDPIYWYRYPTPTTMNRESQKRWRDIFRSKKPLKRIF